MPNPRLAPIRALATLARALSVFALLGTTIPSLAEAQAPANATWSGIAPGPFAVGYRALSLHDSTRTLLPDTLAAKGPEPRVIPVRLWYPGAANARAAAVTVGGIIDRRASAVDSALAARTHGLHRWVAQRYDRAGNVPLVAADTAGLTGMARAVRTIASANLAQAGGRYPLVVFAGGTAHGVDENVALWEHLASFGYVVAVVPTVATQAGAEDAYQPADATGLEAVTRDMELVLAHMLRSPGIDHGRVAAAGFSFGGAGALLLAARNTHVRAVVGLDASFIAGQHLPRIRANPTFDARRLAVPVLEFHRADSSTVDLSLLEGASRSARTSIEIAGLDHVDFGSYALLYAPLLQVRGARAQRDSALAVKVAAYRAMVRTTRAFLDEALGGAGRLPRDPAVLDASGPAWAGVPAAMVRVRRWPAESRRATGAADTTTSLATKIREYARQHDFSGTVLVEHRGQRVFHEGIGVADRAFALPAATDTRYRVASITKTFTAVLVLQLVDEGRLALDTPIARLLPDYRGEGADRITVHHLLNHTSGLPAYDRVASFEEAATKGMEVYQLPHSTDELLTRFSSGKLAHDVGAAFDYNNADYVVLGKIVERVEGAPLDSVLRRRILAPLGLASTGLLRHRDIVARLAPTYMRPGERDSLINDLPMYPENWYAAGAMYSTTTDLATFARALYGGRLLRPASLERMLKPGLDDYGYGLWVATHKIGGRPHRFAQRPGRIMGANVLLLRYLDDDLTIVVLGNTNLADTDKFGFFIGKAVLE